MEIIWLWELIGFCLLFRTCEFSYKGFKLDWNSLELACAWNILRLPTGCSYIANYAICATISEYGNSAGLTTHSGEGENFPMKLELAGRFHNLNYSGSSIDILKCCPTQLSDIQAHVWTNRITAFGKITDCDLLLRSNQGSWSYSYEATIWGLRCTIFPIKSQLCWVDVVFEFGKIKYQTLHVYYKSYFHSKKTT